MRDRLINLIDDFCRDKYVEKYIPTQEAYHFFIAATAFADYLLDDGWIRPPCKVGDTVWHLMTHYDGQKGIRKGKVSMLQQKADKSWKIRITVNSSVWDFTPNEIGTLYFLTREEAEQAMKGGDRK